MFHEIVDDRVAGAADAGDDAVTAATLLASLEVLVSEAAAEAGHDRLGDETKLDGATLQRAAAGDVVDLSIADGAAVVAVTRDYDANTIVAEVRDHLLMGMAMAVLDVDTIAASIDADLTGQEVQQVLEGRTPMTFEQLAEIMAVIENRKR